SSVICGSESARRMADGTGGWRVSLWGGAAGGQGGAAAGGDLPLSRLPQASRGAVLCGGDFRGRRGDDQRRDQPISGAPFLPPLRLVRLCAQRGRGGGASGQPGCIRSL